MAKDSLLDINDILDEYSVEVQDGIKAEAKKVAKDGADELKKTSPKRTGKYRKGWKVKDESGKNYVRCTIHNSTNYQLTHLLEKPHATRNGGTTKPKVHIKPVEEKCIKKYEANVIKIIENGG